MVKTTWKVISGLNTKRKHKKNSDTLSRIEVHHNEIKEPIFQYIKEFQSTLREENDNILFSSNVGDDQSEETGIAEEIEIEENDTAEEIKYEETDKKRK